MPARLEKSGKTSRKKTGAKKASGKRTLIAPKGDKRYVRRDAQGRFTESDDQGRSLSRDVKQHAKKEAKSGYGDQGDQPQRKSAATKKTSSPKSRKK